MMMMMMIFHIYIYLYKNETKNEKAFSILLPLEVLLFQTDVTYFLFEIYFKALCSR